MQAIYKPLFTFISLCNSHKGFPGGSTVKNSPANARDAFSIPGSGRSPGKGNGNPLQYSCLENPMDRSLAGCDPWGYKRVRHDLVTKQLSQDSEG